MPRLPDRRGYFGEFGGRFVPETLMAALHDLERCYRDCRREKAFQRELQCSLADFAGRPTPLYYAERLSKRLRQRIFLKREDLLHTGAHKINNTIGQALLTLRMKKKRVIAETGAGQHGVATATVAARFGLACDVFMGEEDMRRQALNVFRMRLLGARVRCVRSGSRTLKDAMNEALRDWVSSVRTTHYIIGSVAGPHPFPVMVRDFQSVIGEETRRQLRDRTGRLPDILLACVGGGSNALGMFYPFLRQSRVRLIGVEAAGRGLSSGAHGAALCAGSVGVLHGSRSYVLQNNDGQINVAHSISAGLDYPGVGPEHAFLKKTRRAEYVAITDREALDALEMLSRQEGIIPALESAHAIAYLIKQARRWPAGRTIVVCLSGRGDKDMDLVSRIRRYE